MRAKMGRKSIPVAKKLKLSRKRMGLGMEGYDEVSEVRPKQMRYWRAQKLQLTRNLDINRRAKTNHPGNNALQPELQSYLYS